MREPFEGIYSVIPTPFAADETLDLGALRRLVEDLVARHVIRAGDGGFEKGSTWVLSTKDGVPTKARYLPAP